MTIEVSIVNETLEFVQKDSIISIILALSTLALVVITAIGLWRTNKHTVDSNNLMRKEMRNRLRPWIKVGLMQAKTITLTDNHMIGYDESKILSNISKYKIKHVTMAVPIDNVGNLPTKTRTHTVLFQKEEFGKEELRDKGKHLQKGPLMPSEDIHYYFDIPINLWEGKKGEVLFYIGIEVDYAIDKNSNYKVGKIWRVYHDTCLLTGTGYWIN